MRDNPYKDLPPLERRLDGSLYRMTPAQRKQAASLIRRECCCCEDGNCIALDDGDTCTCPQTISFSVCCKWFRWAVLPLDGTLEAGENTARTAPPEFTGGRKQKVNGKGGLLWTVRSEKSLDFQGFASSKPGQVV